MTRCKRAIAYLKAEVADDDPAPVLALDHDNSPVLRRLGNGLLVSYVVDAGEQFELINSRQLEAEGLSGEDLHRIGLGNLAEAVNALGMQVQPYGSIFAVIAGGNFEASLLLLDDLWERAFRQFVSGDYAVAIPSRDVLAFGDAGDAKVRVELRAVIDRVWPSGDHLLVDRVLARTAGGWEMLAD